MAEEDDFKIKGAAQKNETPEKPRAGSEKRPEAAKSTPEQAEPQQAGGGVDHSDDEGDEQDAREEGEVEGHEDRSDEEKYRWFKCVADEAVYGKDPYSHPDPAQQKPFYYWLHVDTKESSWTEPTEPFWIYDSKTGKADPIGLQFPQQATRTREDVLGLDTAAKWGGYDPKIHGDYDPNADYAKFHEARRVEETAASNPFDTSGAPDPSAATTTPYGSTMSLNRFSGRVQATGAGPERHSDAAKSGRQLNAFFDVDAAANAHDGRSLKEERQRQRLSKADIEAYKAARAAKKQKRRLAFLTS